VHVKEPIPSTHAPLPLHVCLWHSSMLFAQLTPFHPNAHTHEYALTASVHVAPLMHAPEAHSSISTAQLAPE
jgi:hypothetical protein